MKTRSRIVSWTSHTSSCPTFSSESTAIFRGLRALLRWGPHNVLYSWGGRGTTTTLVALVWFTRQTYCLNLTVPLRTDNQHVGDNFREMWLPALTYTKLVYLVSSHCLTDNKIDRIKDTRSTTVQKCSACFLMTLHRSPSEATGTLRLRTFFFTTFLGIQAKDVLHIDNHRSCAIAHRPQ